MDKLTTAKLAEWCEGVRVWLEHLTQVSSLERKLVYGSSLLHKAWEKKMGMPPAESAGSLS